MLLNPGLAIGRHAKMIDSLAATAFPVSLIGRAAAGWIMVPKQFYSPSPWTIKFLSLNYITMTH
jgi:hypothetical protein